MLDEPTARELELEAEVKRLREGIDLRDEAQAENVATIERLREELRLTTVSADDLDEENDRLREELAAYRERHNTERAEFAALTRCRAENERLREEARVMKAWADDYKEQRDRLGEALAFIANNGCLADAARARRALDIEGKTPSKSGNSEGSSDA